MIVHFKKVHPRARTPEYKTSGSAGADVFAVVDEEGGGPMTIVPGERRLVRTGLKLAVPQGYEVQIRPRSGIALKEGVTVANSPGTIDSDYRGEVGVLLINHGQRIFYVYDGDRVAQFVVAQVPVAMFSVVGDGQKLEDTARGAGGFGSTGA